MNENEKKLIVVISDPAYPDYGEDVLLKYEDNENYKPYVLSDGKSIFYNYEKTGQYCFALLSQWKNDWWVIKELILKCGFGTEVFVFLHSTDAPNPENINLYIVLDDELGKFSNVENFVKKNIKVFSHDGSLESECVKNLLSAVADLKSGESKEKITRFREAFEDALRMFQSFAVPQTLIAIHLLLQGKAFTEENHPEITRELVKRLKEQELIKKEIEGLGRVKENNSKDLKRLRELIELIGREEELDRLKELEEEFLACFENLHLQYPEIVS